MTAFALGKPPCATFCFQSKSGLNLLSPDILNTFTYVITLPSKTRTVGLLAEVVT